jgi:hypothetical protein
MELTRLMRRYPVHRYQMRNLEGGDYELVVRGDIDRTLFEADISSMFGSAVQVCYDDA